jgi:hypothetical protein
MNKFLLGLVLGTLLGYFVAASLRDDPISPATLTSEGGAENPATAPLPNHAQTDKEGAAGIANPSRPASGTDPAASAASLARGNTVPAPTMQPQTSLPSNQSLPPTQSQRNREPTDTTAAQPRTPISVPDAIKPFLEKSDTHDGLTLGQMHANLEGESEDFAWSYQMEQYLQQSLARPTKSGQPLDIRVLECRTTMCEIVGFSTLSNPLDDVGPILQQMGQQPWWDFDNVNSTAAGDGSGGKFMLFLRRKR